MKVVKKFTSFEELKSYKTKSTSHASRVKKHNDFKTVIKSIASAAAQKPNQSS